MGAVEDTVVWLRDASATELRWRLFAGRIWLVAYNADGGIGERWLTPGQFEKLRALLPEDLRIGSGRWGA